MQRLSLLLASAVLVGAAMSTPSIAGTVAYYRFEEGTANNTATGLGTILDNSGNGLNGTPLNGPVYKSTVALPVIPHTGAANALSMQFSGTGGQRVFVNDSAQFAIPGSLTIEAYFNVFAIPNAAGAILFRGDDRTGFDPYFLNVEAGQVRFGITNPANQETLVTAPLPGLNQWIYAAGVLNTTTGTMSLYINGTLATSISTSATPLVLLDPTMEPGIGVGGHPSSFFNDFMSFDGLIDEVKLSDSALTPDQFLNAHATVPEPASFGMLAIFAGALAVRRRRA
jgi:concanavalin A-like lectin/glucanase superfamily protein/PEP-CTERM motif-containing protein